MGKKIFCVFSDLKAITKNNAKAFDLVVASVSTLVIILSLIYFGASDFSREPCYAFADYGYGYDSGDGGGVPPAPPIPPGTTDVSGVIGTDGTFMANVVATTSDGKATLTIDKGTKGLDKDGHPLSQISMNPYSPPPTPPVGANIIGLTYDFEPSGATFNPPLELVFAGAPLDSVIMYWNGSSWIELATHIVGGVLVADVPHFTVFAVLTRVAALPKPTPTASPTPTQIPTPTVTPTPTPSPTPTPVAPTVTPSSTNLTRIIIIALVALALISGVVAFILWRRHRYI
jgi:hypothetical protein